MTPDLLRAAHHVMSTSANVSPAAAALRRRIQRALMTGVPAHEVNLIWQSTLELTEHADMLADLPDEKPDRQTPARARRRPGNRP